MTRVALITRVVKPVLYLSAVLPFGYLAVRLGRGDVEGDQVKFLQHVTGDTVLACLLLTLSITPLRRLTGWNELIRVRRLIGLTAFWYAVIHFFSYLVFDHSLSPADIAEDIVEHPWVLLGFAAFLMLVPLAVTSTKGWVRRLGGKRWQRLHLLVYPATAAGLIHYFWLVKKDVTDPIYWAVALAALLALRLVKRSPRRLQPLPLSQQGGAR
ncbi:MAG TPA: protein-methionine-sulfoxide reductase heme-binding subunit MsrQ [Gemmatimonadales bacterium]|jgi:sulfoxide reductase heme-binding subunit YedZ|nr:protein-methionine-sulfoxide reductase heme-binding subunit MsrQ [Gemmatimonadales bacterium]